MGQEDNRRIPITSLTLKQPQGTCETVSMPLVPGGTELGAQMAEKSKGSRSFIYMRSGRQSCLWSSHSHLQTGMSGASEFPLSGLDRGLHRETTLSVPPPPASPAKPIHFVPFQFPFYSQHFHGGNFGESCGVGSRPSVTPFTTALKGPTTSPLTLKINRKH